MKVNLSKIVLFGLFGLFLIGGTNLILFENVYADNSFHVVTNPEFPGKATSASIDEKTNKI